MYRVKEYMTHIIKKGKLEDMETIEEFFYKLLCKVHTTDPHMADWIISEMKEMVMGKVLTVDEAKHWVAHMQPCGEHWTMEQTTSVKKVKGYTYSNIDWYVVMNMMYNDYNDIVKENDALVIKMACDWLSDTDAVDCKLYHYYKYMIKK